MAYKKLERRLSKTDVVFCIFLFVESCIFLLMLSLFHNITQFPAGNKYFISATKKLNSSNILSVNQQVSR